MRTTWALIAIGLALAGLGQAVGSPTLALAGWAPALMAFLREVADAFSRDPKP